MRSAADADRHGHAHAGDLRFELAVAVENLNALVTLIDNVDIPLCVGRDRMRQVELTGIGAARAPRQEKPAVAIELRDPRVRSMAVGDENVPVAIECYVARADELIASTPGTGGPPGSATGWRAGWTRRRQTNGHRFRLPPEDHQHTSIGTEFDDLT